MPPQQHRDLRKSGLRNPYFGQNRQLNFQNSGEIVRNNGDFFQIFVKNAFQKINNNSQKKIRFERDF